MACVKLNTYLGTKLHTQSMTESNAGCEIISTKDARSTLTNFFHWSYTANT